MSWRGVSAVPGACAAVLLFAPTGCGGGGGGSTTVVTRVLRVDASTVTGELRPLWRDHYDLSYEHFAYASEPGFPALLASLAPRSWRCSVGRWEIGFPPPTGGDSLDPLALAQVEREFYRGPNTLAGADDPASYDFGYLDALLSGLVAAGVQPYLCFDYMPFALASEQDPLNPANANLNLPGTPYSTYSFSNGIRTSPPADPAVYARVVRNTMRHVRGLFAGTTDYGVQWFEVGNEPDLVDPLGAPLPFFWTGTAADFFAMYSAVATEVDADPDLSGTVQLGAGSFAFLPSPAGVGFLQDFLLRVAAGSPRLDYLSFHTYGDLQADHLGQFLLVDQLAVSAGVSVPWVNAEWGRELGGTEPVYDAIEHGIFRAEVLATMQVFPFVLAHEALFRDPGTSGGELGLVRTGPPAHKPVSRVYQGLAALNDTPDAVAVTDNPDGLFVLPARDSAGTRIVVALAVAEPASGTIVRHEVDVDALPWGTGSFDVALSRVTQASAEAGIGVELVSAEVRAGGALSWSFDVAPGEQGLYVLELDAP